MRINIDTKDQLLLELKQVPLIGREDWKWLNNGFKVTRMTRKAAEIGDKWIPISQLRADHDSKLIYVSAWWYQKELRGKLQRIG